MCSDPAPLKSDQPVNQFAVVTYIPGELGDFLNKLRVELVDDCSALAHVTVLPPRPLVVETPVAENFLDKRLRHARAFPLGIAEIQVFEQTDVIYAEIGTGREALLDLHYELNHSALGFVEQYPYHPHVTLAQNVDHNCIPEMFEHACRRWIEWMGERSFLLDRVTFVQNSEQNRWRDLSEYRLRVDSDPRIR
jgi:2'-5' RNA ligase